TAICALQAAICWVSALICEIASLICPPRFVRFDESWVPSELNDTARACASVRRTWRLGWLVGSWATALAAAKKLLIDAPSPFAPPEATGNKADRVCASVWFVCAAWLDDPAATSCW